MRSPQRGTGTGFVLEGNKILTNAHVVSDARYIEVQRIGDDKKYLGKVQHIAHDCDLAILEVGNASDFFSTMTPLKMGDLPKIDSVVTTYGFPMGGAHLSVTRGVVSRIQMWSYAHSSSDSHLVIQTDAAINPGNSGGPVMQDGHVVGVAFQGLTQADNIGYLIPSTVVRHFLKDIEDGFVHGFGELGLSYRLDLQNPLVRASLDLPESESGVLVTKVFPRMPASNAIEAKDVILEIGGHTIRNDGLIIMDDMEVNFSEAMERLQVGDEIPISLWRDGEKKTMKLPLKAWDMIVDHRMPYDVAPRFKIFAGLCFTPLSKGYVLSAGGLKKQPLSVRTAYLRSMADPSLDQDLEYPILSTSLSHDCNTGSKEFVGWILDKIGSFEIHNIDDIQKALDASKEDYLVFHFLGKNMPLVLNRKEATQHHHHILNLYRVENEESSH
jgi:S1-C subfamily serine protease